MTTVHEIKETQNSHKLSALELSVSSSKLCLVHDFTNILTCVRLCL